MLIKIRCGGYIGDSLFTMEIPVNNDEEYYRGLNKLLSISPVKNKLWRIGKHGDGGYIMPDVFRGGGIAYSFGINDDMYHGMKIWQNMDIMFTCMTIP